METINVALDIDLKSSRNVILIGEKMRFKCSMLDAYRHHLNYIEDVWLCPGN